MEFVFIVVLVIIFAIFAFSGGGNSDMFIKFATNIGKIKYSEYQNGTGIAITNCRHVVLCSGDTCKAYTFNQIRDWTKSIETATYVSGMGVAAAARADMLARAGTGLFISVKDIDYPEWHIKIRDKKMLARWFEILQQELND